jgi:hypothetical protein
VRRSPVFCAVLCCAVLCCVLWFVLCCCTGEFKVRLTVTGRQGKGTRGDQCILVKTIVVARGKEKKNECGKKTIYSRGRLAKGWSAGRQVPKV